MRGEDFPQFLNGRRLAPGEPALSVEDAGFTLGLAVFETLLFEDGLTLFAEEHLARFARGAEALGIDWRRGALDPAAALAQMEQALGGRTAVLRLTGSRGAPGAGPTLVVTSRRHEPPPEAGVVIAIATHTVPEGDEHASLKSTNRIAYVLAREEAQRFGAWEGLVATRAGDLCEGTVSNLFVVRGGRLLTPSTRRGCLAGTTRDRLLADLARRPLELAGGGRLEVVVDRVERADLFGADEVLLSNTTGRVVAVTEVRDAAAGGRVVAGPLPGVEGAVTRALRERLAGLERAYRAERERGAGRGGRAAPGATRRS